MSKTQLTLDFAMESCHKVMWCTTIEMMNDEPMIQQQLIADQEEKMKKKKREK